MESEGSEVRAALQLLNTVSKGKREISLRIGVFSFGGFTLINCRERDSSRSAVFDIYRSPRKGKGRRADMNDRGCRVSSLGSLFVQSTHTPGRQN
jgi:hypothetical protein